MDFDHILDDLYLQLNQVRLHPQETASKISAIRKDYHGKLLRNQTKTREGVAALDDLVKEMFQRSPIGHRLQWSFALHMVADEQASRLGNNGLFTTEGTTQHTTLPERVKQYAIVKGRISEIYEFGGKSATDILEELLIDDGLASRKRRQTLLDPIYKYIGIGSSYHTRDEVEACTVIVLAEDIISLVAPGQNGTIKKKKITRSGEDLTIKMTKQIMIGNDLQKNFLDLLNSNADPGLGRITVNNGNSGNNPDIRNSNIGGNNVNSGNSGVYGNNSNNGNNSNINPRPSVLPPPPNPEPQFIIEQPSSIANSRFPQNPPLNNTVFDASRSSTISNANNSGQPGYMNERKQSSLVIHEPQPGFILNPADSGLSQGTNSAGRQQSEQERKRLVEEQLRIYGNQDRQQSVAQMGQDLRGTQVIQVSPVGQATQNSGALPQRAITQPAVTVTPATVQNPPASSESKCAIM